MSSLTQSKNQIPPWYLPKKSKNMSTQNLYTNVCNTIIHDSQKVETAQVFFN